jgi:glycosyltransferase involved in cell wall biosynthesis
MDIAFIYWGPHPMHKTWVDGITEQKYSFIPKITLNLFRAGNPLLHQFLAFIHSPIIPKSDVYLIENMACILPVILRKKKNSKIILMNCDNFFYDVFPKSKGIMRKIYFFYLKQINGIISNSKYIKKISQKYTSIPNFVVNPGINSKYFKIDSNRNSNIAHGLSALRKQKGTDLVIKAFEKMNLNNQLYLIGPKGDVSIPKDKRIIFTGWTDRPEKYLINCGIYVNPARFDSFGMNMVEAMAAGFAPIVSENCGAKEIVAKLDKKLIIKPTVSEIIKTINWVKEGNRKEVLGKKAKEIAKKYTIEKSTKKFRKEFFDLMGEIRK